MINVFLFHKGKDVILLFPILLLYHFLNCFYDRYVLTRMLGKMLACVLVIKDIPRIIALKKHILSEKNIPFETFYKHLSYKIIDEFYVPAPYKHFIRIVNACVKQYFRLFRIPFYEERLQTPKH